jgi:hypothetical protein
MVWPEEAERRAASRISVTMTLVSRDESASGLAHYSCGMQTLMSLTGSA